MKKRKEYKLDCINCGATISFEEDIKQFICQSCGISLNVCKRGGKLSLEALVNTFASEKVLILDAENHYNNLIKYFKNLVWIASGVIALIVLFAGVFSFQDRQAIKKEVDFVKRLATQEINRTSQFAEDKIKMIKNDSEEIALNEARRRVQEAFKTNNIQELVENTTQEEVLKSIDAKLGDEVDNAYKTIVQELESIVKISDSAMRMRMGFKPGCISLQNIIVNSNTNKTKELAILTYESILNDYEEVCMRTFIEIFPDTSSIRTLKKIPFGFYEKEMTIENIINSILTERNLNDITYFTFILRIKVNHHFKLFDFVYLRSWWKKNKDKYLVEVGK